MEKTKQRVVILGGGFGGLMTAQKLARRHKGAEIFLVDAQDYHLYTPWLYRLPSDAWYGRQRRTCEFKYEKLMVPYGERIHFRQGRVSHINVEAAHVTFSDGGTLRYDHLVIALGSQANYFGLKNVAAVAHTLNTPQAVLDMYTALDDLLKTVKMGEKRRVVVAGAGATGIELSMELAALQKRHKLNSLDLTLVDTAPTLLRRFSPYIQKHATKRAKYLHINIAAQTMITDYADGALKVSRADKSLGEIPADLVVWAGGSLPSAVLGPLPYSKDDSGRLLVNEYLQVKDAHNIWALGDCASFWDAHNSMALPPTAWAATDQSAILAHNLAVALDAQDILNKRPMIAYRPPAYYPGVIALGGWYAAGGASGLNVSGFIGWVLKQLIHLNYFRRIMPFGLAMRAWVSKKDICDI